MSVNIFSDFLGKKVDVGIPNFMKPNQLFFVSGVLIEANEQYLILKINDGLRRIPLNDVIKIEISKERYND